MNAKSLFVLLAVFSPAATQPEDRLPKDLAALQGTWKLVGFEGEGHKEENLPPVARWVIKNNKVLYAGEGLATLTVDAGNPKIIDLVFTEKKKTYEGVYALDGDTLKICVSVMAEGVKERPLGFDTKDKPDRRLLVFQRDKSKGDGSEDAGGFVGIAIGISKDGQQVYVASVIAKSPAEKGGLKKDDVILKIGTTQATGVRQVVDLVRQAKPRSELNVHVRRGEKEQDIRVKVGVLPFYLLDF